MKSQITKKHCRFVATIMLSVSIIVIYNSCQKETSRDTIKTNSVSKANNTLSSTIVYTDINPDTLIAIGAVYNLDVNNDGVADFTISNNLSSVVLSCLGNNEVLTDSSLHTLSALASGISIGANSKVWKDTSALIASYSRQAGGCGPGGNHIVTGCIDYIYHGPFLSQSAAFLGLRIHKGVNTYYAWARLTATLPYPYITSKTAPLKAFVVSMQDYAYNSGIGQPILTGQTK